MVFAGFLFSSALGSGPRELEEGKAFGVCLGIRGEGAARERARRENIAAAVAMARKSIAVETKAEVPEEWKRKADGDVLEGVVALPDHKKQRKEWACALRKLLSPPDMLHEDGTIKQVYFRPKKVVIHQPRRWGEDEKRKLIEGLALYGVGGWRDIKSKLLPKWDENTLRVKSCRLIGCQNLKRYASWKPTRNQIEEAFKKNKKLGSSLGCWKAGMLVDNDNKDVEKALEKMGGKS